MNRRHPTTFAVALASLTLVVSGCSLKTPENAGGGGEGARGVKTGEGVTEDTITLGNLTDTSGVFKTLGLAITQGTQLWASDINAEGGICGRKIKVTTADHGYTAEKAVPQYNRMKTDVLGLIQLLGSPVLAALKQPIVNDKVAAIPASWASDNLDVPNVVMVGPTYDVEMINGLAELQRRDKIKDGDTIGHIYVDSEYGKNALKGSIYYAKKHKMRLVRSSVTSTEADLTSAVTQLKAQGVKAMLITGTPAQSASALGVARAQGVKVPIFGSGPSYTPQLLETPAAPVLLSGQFETSALQVPYNYEKAPLAQELARRTKAKYPKQVPTYGQNQGYANGLVWGAILKQACSDGDLTRGGILKAIRKTSVDTRGLTPALDFTKPGQPSTRAGYPTLPAKVPGGLKITGDPVPSDEALEYKTPFQGKEQADSSE
ncbi:ABC transporter substrate-binding protein [Demetria terragena]|uniref:ABC transporter substrate-binding protein n=1 Tax=Demetria terragena TaxID=63959 RepID=UPI00037E4F67|nr:ABC transporter substrate-binding protein [Demetria terragena]